MVNKGSVLNGKPLIMKWYTPKPGPPHPTIPAVKTSKLSSLPLPHHHSATDISKSTSLNTTMRRVVIEEKTYTNDQVLNCMKLVRNKNLAVLFTSVQKNPPKVLPHVCTIESHPYAPFFSALCYIYITNRKLALL